MPSRKARQKRKDRASLAVLATTLGVTVDYLVIGEGWEEARRLELLLDHAELSLVGGEAPRALEQAREALAAATLGSVPGGVIRARYVEAAALDATGDLSATSAFEALLGRDLESSLRLKVATALSRIWREQGQLERAIAVAESAIADVPAVILASEEGIRLSVTLAAALFTAGRVEEAAETCDRAIAESERLSSPLARASAYWNASIIRDESGNVTEAIGLARRALHLLESTERVRDLGRLRTELSAIMLRSNPPRVDEAQEQLKIAATELDWSEASPTDRARNDLVNARALFLAGESTTAEMRARAALAAADDLPLVAVNALTLLGQIAWADGDRDEAHAWYRQAIARLTGVGADREAGQLWFELGTLASEAGLVAESADAFRRAAVSTGLSARLPVVNQPLPSAPRTTPATTTAGRL